MKLRLYGGLRLEVKGEESHRTSTVNVVCLQAVLLVIPRGLIMDDHSTPPKTLSEAIYHLQTPSSSIATRINSLRFLQFYLEQEEIIISSVTDRIKINQLILDNILLIINCEDLISDLRRRQLVKTECFLLLAKVLNSKSLFAGVSVGIGIPQTTERGGGGGVRMSVDDSSVQFQSSRSGPGTATGTGTGSRVEKRELVNTAKRGERNQQRIQTTGNRETEMERGREGAGGGEGEVEVEEDEILQQRYQKRISKKKILQENSQLSRSTSQLPSSSSPEILSRTSGRSMSRPSLSSSSTSSSAAVVPVQIKPVSVSASVSQHPDLFTSQLKKIVASSTSGSVHHNDNGNITSLWKQKSSLYQPRQSVMIGSRLKGEHLVPGVDPQNHLQIDKQLGYQKSRLWVPFNGPGMDNQFPSLFSFISS
jgi:hypothetical protein